MIREPYQAGSSSLHLLDARIKVVMALALIIGIVVTPEQAFPAYPLLWTVIASLAAVNGLGVWRLAKLGSLALPFSLVAFPLLFTVAGQPLIQIMGLEITGAGLARFLPILIKSWLALQVGLMLAITTPFMEILGALKYWKIPSILAEIMAFMYRYLFTLQEEASRLLQARASRSGYLTEKRRRDLIWEGQVAGYMVGNLFLRSYERSERIYQAMLARGYTGVSLFSPQKPLLRKDIIYGALPLAAILIIQMASLLWWK